MNFSTKANNRLDLAALTPGCKVAVIVPPSTSATRRAFAMKRAKQLIIDQRMVALRAAAEKVVLYVR